MRETKIKITAQGIYAPGALPEYIGGGVIIIEWFRRGQWTLYQGLAPGIPDRVLDESTAGWRYRETVNEFERIRRTISPHLQETAASNFTFRVIDHSFTVGSSDSGTWVPELDMTLGSCLSRIGFRPDILDLLW